MTHAATALAAAMLLVNVAFTAHALFELRRERRPRRAVGYAPPSGAHRSEVTIRVRGGNPRGNQNGRRRETPMIYGHSAAVPAVS